jgi:phosphotriesterase-related protein
MSDPQSPSGVIRTVCGDVPAARFTAVMVHEHLLYDITPPGVPAANRCGQVTLQNRWQADYRSNEMAANARQQDWRVAAAELAAFGRDGGDLIVDQSVGGLARDATGLQAAARASGCSVVAAAGTYTAAYLDDATRAADTDTLAARFVAEVETGMDGTDIRAGLIGEIGCSWPLQDVERRALVAAARAGRATGAGISVHPGRDARAPFEIVDILADAGADLSRVALCHMDRTYPEGRDIDGYGPVALARLGVMIEWDFFGIETSHYWMDPDVELPTDRGRLRAIRAAMDAGHGARILVSHDVCTRTRAQAFGGHGYGHVLRNVVPLMRRMGFSAAEVAQLIRFNPLRLLALPQAAPAPEYAA